nr:condensation domain-containing protein [uncultured bacterium]
MEDVSKRIARLTPEQRRLLRLKLKGAAPDAPKASGIPRREVSTPCPVSANQEWLWSVDRLTGGNPAWNVFTGGAFSGPLDVAVLERCLNEIIKRHEVLRTTLRDDGGRLAQHIAPALKIELPVIDLRDVPEAEREAEVKRLTTEQYRQVFDLAAGPLVRPALYRLAADEHRLLVVMHHTVTDWVSFMLLNKEMVTLYQAFLEGSGPTLPELPIQYGDYAVWERGWLGGEAAAAQLSYWRRQLKDAPACVRLPLDRPRPPVQTVRGARHPVTFTPETSEALRALTQQENVTLFITLLTALYVLLHRHAGGQEDIVVGTPVIGRKPPETQNLIGLFLNHLALRADLTGNPSFRELLGRVRRTVVDGYAHQELPFGAVVKELLPEPDPSRNPFFQVMFFFLAVPTIVRFSSLTLRNFEAYGETARYDLLVSVWDRGESIGGFFEYNTALFERATAARLAADYEALVDEIVSDPDRRLSDLSAGRPDVQSSECQP